MRTRTLFLALMTACSLTADAAAQLGTPYCPGRPNSTGSPATLFATGSLEVARNDLTLRCGQLPAGSFGHFLVARARGFVPNPGGSAGDLCLGGPVGRYSGVILDAGASGSVAMPVDLTRLPAPAGPFAAAPGDLLTFQYWHRDTAAGGAPTSNLSGGLAVVLGADCDPPFGRFPSQEFPTDGWAGALVQGDLDGDGLADIVVVNIYETWVSVHQSRAARSFSAPERVDIGETARDVALGDVDGDGDLDLVVASTLGSFVAVALNEGDGTFGTPRRSPTGREPAAVALADLDGDWDLDVVTANSAWQEDTISVLANDGAGGLAPRVDHPVLRGPGSLALGDFDGDGDVDVVTGNLDSGTVALLRNVGGGTLGAAEQHRVVEQPRAVAAADLDGDGDLDLVAAGGMGGRLSVLANPGDGRFLPRVEYERGLDAQSFDIADLDADGDLDVAFTTEDNELGWLPNLGGTTLGARIDITGASYPHSVRALDVDRDGVLDLVTSVLEAPGLGVVLGTGGGRFPTRLDIPTGSNPSAVVAGDLDGDGRLDLVSTHHYGEGVSTVLATGPEQFAAPVEIRLGARPLDAHLADVDRDGDLDIVVAVPARSRVSTLLNTGNGSFSAGAPLRTRGWAWWTALGDLDGDGAPDLLALTASGYPPMVALWRHSNRGDGSFEPGELVSLQQSFGTGLLDDLDSDGDLDLLVARGWQGELEVHTNLGSGTFAPPVSTYVRPSPDPYFARVDLDADGDRDLVLKSANGLMLLEPVSSSFVVRGFVPLETVASPVVVSDIDGDGDGDLLVGQGYRPRVAVFTNEGAFSLSAPTYFSTSLYPEGVTAADLDGDGDQDIVAASAAMNVLSVLWNRCR